MSRYKRNYAVKGPEIPPGRASQAGRTARKRLLALRSRAAEKASERAPEGPPEDPSCAGVECQPERCSCWCHE